LLPSPLESIVFFQLNLFTHVPQRNMLATCIEASQTGAEQLDAPPTR
jgi:hypothetical protein